MRYPGSLCCSEWPEMSETTVAVDDAVVCVRAENGCPVLSKGSAKDDMDLSSGMADSAGAQWLADGGRKLDSSATDSAGFL